MSIVNIAKTEIIYLTSLVDISLHFLILKVTDAARWQIYLWNIFIEHFIIYYFRLLHARCERIYIFDSVALRISGLMDCISCCYIVIRNVRRWVKVQRSRCKIIAARRGIHSALNPAKSVHLMHTVTWDFTVIAGDRQSKEKKKRTGNLLHSDSVLETYYL